MDNLTFLQIGLLLYVLSPDSRMDKDIYFLMHL